MDLEGWIDWAREQGASDLHLEPGLPATVRVRGELRLTGQRVQPRELVTLARGVIGEARWPELTEQCSADLSRTVKGTRCRIHVMRTARGVGMAVRLLSAPASTLQRLNLHPSLARLARAPHGLVLVSGPTGSGKTSTAAALLQEINLAESRHVITLESPIEYALTPRRAFIRQREVGRDTPSFAQGLFDAMREDPDVIFVGELRDPEVMRLTLNAAETGHLVLATVHSATVVEALHRMVSAFPAEGQAGICAQLGDCLLAVVAQHLVYRDDLGMRVPECEILVASSAARAVIRQGQISKLPTVIETSAEDGSWSVGRYRAWLAAKKDWSRGLEPATDDDAAEVTPPPELEGSPETARPPAAKRGPAPARPAVASRPAAPPPPEANEDGVLVLDDTGDDPSAVLAEIERRSGRDH